MRPIDLVKHQTTLLPGLEQAAYTLVRQLNEARRALKLSTLNLIEDPQDLKTRRETIRNLTAREKLKAQSVERKRRDAEEARQRIAAREQASRIKARNVKTLVKRRRA